MKRRMVMAKIKIMKKRFVVPFAIVIRPHRSNRSSRSSDPKGELRTIAVSTLSHFDDAVSNICEDAGSLRFSDTLAANYSSMKKARAALAKHLSDLALEALQSGGRWTSAGMALRLSVSQVDAEEILNSLKLENLAFWADGFWWQIPKGEEE